MKITPPTITPEMELAHFAATTRNERIGVSLKMDKIISLHIYDYRNGYNDLYAVNAMHYDFNRQMCLRWIFEANQAIEQYIAQQEMALRQFQAA